MPNSSIIHLHGHLGRDAESRAAGTTTVVKFSIAVTRKRKETETTAWFNCSWFGDRAYKVAQYLTKGKPLYVVGELYEHEYDAKDGTKKKSLEVDVRDVVLLGSKEDDTRGGQPPVRPAVKADLMPVPTHAQSVDSSEPPF